MKMAREGHDLAVARWRLNEMFSTGRWGQPECPGACAAAGAKAPRRQTSRKRVEAIFTRRTKGEIGRHRLRGRRIAFGLNMQDERRRR
jgi:hypothetical protein